MHHSELLLREYAGAPVSVLAATDQDADVAALRFITFNTQWKVHTAGRISEAVEALKDQNIGVVIANRQLPDGTWDDLLQSLRLQRNAARLIVCSPAADTRFWAQVLSMGGYDVLATPFERAEVLRAGYLGWLSWSRASRITPSVPERRISDLSVPITRTAKAG
ncbi:MAG TPA: response regulator [Bryobacteraceae bacterium]|nr:response regulator [Bryobacteraceae bacterium]